MRELAWILLTAGLTLNYPASAGQLRFMGQWIDFQDIIPEGGPSIIYTTPGGLVATEAKAEAITHQPIKMYFIFGDYVGMPPQLESRFWRLRDVTMSLQSYDFNGPLSLTSDAEVQKPIERPEAWYELKYMLKGRTDEDALRMFSTLTKAANIERANYQDKVCLEMTGEITWWSNENMAGSKKPLYTYTLFVNDVRIAGHLPADVNSSSDYTSTLDEATRICTESAEDKP